MKKIIFTIAYFLFFSYTFSQECNEKELEIMGEKIKVRGEQEEKENNRKFEVALEKMKIAKKWTEKQQMNYLLEVVTPELVEKTAANRAVLVNDLLKIFKDSNETESKEEKCLLLSKMVNKLDEIVKYNANEWKETLEKISKDYKVATGNELSFE